MQVLQYKKKCKDLEQELETLRAESDRSKVAVNADRDDIIEAKPTTCNVKGRVI